MKKFISLIILLLVWLLPLAEAGGNKCECESVHFEHPRCKSIELGAGVEAPCQAKGVIETEVERDTLYVPNGTLDSVYAANGQVCYSLSGSESSVCADYPPNTNVVVVRDGEGNEYIVTIYPEPATVEGPFNYMVNLGDSTSLLDENDNVLGEFKIISVYFV